MLSNDKTSAASRDTGEKANRAKTSVANDQVHRFKRFEDVIRYGSLLSVTIFNQEDVVDLSVCLSSTATTVLEEEPPTFPIIPQCDCHRWHDGETPQSMSKAGISTYGQTVRLSAFRSG